VHSPHFFDLPDRTTTRDNLDIPPDVFLGVAFGMFVNHRRLEHLIEAMAHLSDDPSIHALIPGSDHVDPLCADALQMRIDDLGLSDRVRLSRRTFSESEMREMYATADVFAILSKRYAWGLAPLEALASGTPALVSGGAQVADVLAGRPGVAVGHMDDPAMAAATIRRWRRGDGRAGIDQTRDWLREEISMDVYVRRMEDSYDQAVTKRVGQGRPGRAWRSPELGDER
jgi:glycosyltransferase involved in cell wall biosynthesis